MYRRVARYGLLVLLAGTEGRNLVLQQLGGREPYPSSRVSRRLVILAEQDRFHFSPTGNATTTCHPGRPYRYAQRK